MSVLNYSTNASSNTTVGGVSIAEGMPPGNVNNGMRAMMADTRKWQIDVSGVATTTGASNAYAFASAQGVTAYTTGLRICFEADKDNSGAATFAVDALSAKAIKKYTNAGLADVVAGEIQSGAFYDVVYEAAEDSFILLNPSLAIASQVEAEAGTDATKLMTPQRVAQALAARYANTAEIQSLTGTNKLPTTAGIATAAVLTTPSGGANWTPDWSSFISATWVVTADRTLQNPTNVIPGTTRVIRIASDTSAARALSYGTAYKGSLPASVTNAAVALLTLYAVSSSEIVVAGVEYTA